MRFIVSFFSALLGLTLLRQLRSECSNGCSGHGKCTQWDMCVCHRNWQGNDCAERICQFGRAWADSPKGDLDSSGSYGGPEEEVAVNSAAYPYGTSESYPMMRDSDLNIVAQSSHEYAECSNVGLCNRKTGICDCQPGYEGVACHRMSCPGYARSDSTISESYYQGQCSGHGVCQTLAKIAKKDFGSKYMLWDGQQSTACKCDPGYFGPDCFQRKCKLDLDPQYLDDVTTIGFGRYYVPILATSQAATFSSGIPGDSGYFTIKYYDHYGKPYQTDKIYHGADCTDVVAALEGLPNGLVPSGTVGCEKLDVFNKSALEDRPAWEFRQQTRYTKYLAGDRYNTLKVHPVLWMQDHIASYSVNASSDETLSGYVYRLEMLGNYGGGEMREPEVNLYSDGSRATMQVDHGSLFTDLWSDGQRAEGTNFWANHCHEVTVGITTVSGHTILTGFGHGEKGRLKACLGGADHDDDNNGDASTAHWDHGSEDYPHVIRLVKTVTDVTDSGFYVPIVYDTTLTGLDDHGEDHDPTLNMGPDPTGTDGTFRLLIPFEGLDRVDYVSPASYNVEWEVYTTKGVVQKVGNSSEVAFDFASKVIYTANVTLGTTYDGHIACQDKGMTSGLREGETRGACMNKGDWFFLFSPTDINYNPPYLNLYRADAVLSSDEALRGDPTWRSRYPGVNLTMDQADAVANYKTHMIISDVATNWQHEVDAPALFYIYKFFPHYASSYEYVAECSNRGICNNFEGLCECFLGYEGDSCNIHGGLQL